MVACTHRLFALMFSQVDAALPTVSTQDREDTLLHCAYTKYAVDGKEVNSHQCRVSFVSSVPLIHMRRRSRHGAATKSSELAGLYHQRHREDRRQRDLGLLVWICQECKLGEEDEGVHSVLCSCSDTASWARLTSTLA